MIDQVRLKSTNDAYFCQAWELYESAFPVEERRLLSTQKEMMTDPLYHFVVLIIDKEFLGFILWWQFDRCRYIEHFATVSAYRGRGFGGNIMGQFIKETNEAIILEVELPNDFTKKRRICFYERLGFKLNMHYYQQPALQAKMPSIEMLLMSYPAKITEVDLNCFKENFRRLCYTPYINYTDRSNCSLYRVRGLE